MKTSKLSKALVPSIRDTEVFTTRLPTGELAKFDRIVEKLSHLSRAAALRAVFNEFVYLPEDQQRRILRDSLQRGALMVLKEVP